MRSKKLLVLLLGVVMMLAVLACGNKETGKKSDDKKTEEVVQSEIENKKEEDIEISKEVAENEKETQQSEEVKEQQPVQQEQQTTTTNQSKPSTSTNTKKENNSTSASKPTATPSTSTPIETPVETKPEVKECEHWYQPTFEQYDLIEHYVYGCNGCGYPLFTLVGEDAVNLPDLYFHPACKTDRYDEPCTGGGFHSEWFTSAKCGKCRGDVVKRQCMFSVMGLRCIKNEVLGPYAKTEEGQNPTAYIKSCDCGQNIVLKDGATGKGLLFVKETCMYCNDTIHYPQF